MHSFVENNSWVYSLPCKNSVPSLHQVLNLTRDRTCADTSPGSFHLSLGAFSSWKYNLYSLSRYWSAKSHEKIAPISSCWWVSKGKITQSVSSQSWGNHCHWIALGSLRHPTKRRERLLRFPAQKQKRPLAERWWPERKRQMKWRRRAELSVLQTTPKRTLTAHKECVSTSFGCATAQLLHSLHCVRS